LIRRVAPALVGAAMIAAAPADTPEAITAARMKAFPMSRVVEAVEAYTPAEPVPGAERALPLAPTRSREAAAAALAGADAYAEAQKSFAFLVMRDGRLVHERYWQGYGPASRFSTASMHKAVMALAYGNAVQAGRIKLDDPVGRYLPEWSADPRGRITLRQLLRMESGLAAPPGPPGPANPATQLTLGPDIRAAALAFPAAEPPGREFAYANVSSQLAGMALDTATPGRYADWLSRTIWQPIGASDASLWLDRPGGTPHLFCCLQATPRDWVRVGELIRNRGRAGGRQVVPAAWLDVMTSPSPRNPNFGMQIWRGSPYAPERRYARNVVLTVKSAEPFKRDDVLFIDGAGGQRVYVIPSAKLTIVRVGKPSTDWDDSRLPNLVLAALDEERRPGR
jgi:CubicO group peptidase (beta-lactamase class C family)